MTGDTKTKARSDLEERIESIESGYEFLLAYAAQGRQTDRDAGGGTGVRGYLDRMTAALDGLAAVATACAAERDAQLPTQAAEFFAAVDSDARKALAIVRLVLAQNDISSQLVDNLNASIHIRALLTDLFIVDEALKPGRSA